MTLGEVKDVVREHFGRMGVPTHMLDIALTEARKRVEKEGNFWWMRSSTTFNLAADTQTYIIGSGAAINIANFKDARALHYKRSTDVRWEPVELGTVDQEELAVMYDTDDTGAPEFAIIDNVTLNVYPPDPDQAYNMKLFHYNWTANPTLNSDTDDLFKNFGSALVFGAVEWGYAIYLKDLQGAAYWKNELGGTPFGRGGEIARIKRQNLKRDWKDKIMFTPRVGPGRTSKRSLNNVQLYIR